ILLSALAAIFWKSQEDRRERYIKWVMIGLPVTFLMVPASLFFGYGENSSFLWHFMLGRYSHFIMAILFANLFLLLALATVIHTAQSWRHLPVGSGIWATIKRLHLSLICLGAIAGVLFLWFYNFIGIN